MAYKRQHQNLAPVDTDVQLPAAIRAAAARSAALHQEAYETPENGQEHNGKEREQEETKPAPAQEELKAGTEEVPAPTPAGEGGEDFRHMYLSMKGRHEKLEETVRQLTRQLGDLRADNERLARQPAPVPVATPENTFKSLTKEEREAYGEDFLDVATRAAAEKFSPIIDGLKQQIVDLGGKVESTAATAYNMQTLTMNEYLTSQLPDWKKINRDPKFLAWANLRDPYSGAIRLDMLKKAHASGDAERVLNFFKGFLSDEAVADPATTIKQDHVPTPGKVPLESLAAPGRAKAPAASAPPGEKETISRAQIANFYRLVNQGFYRGNEEEKNRLEAELFLAEREGRVIG